MSPMASLLLSPSLPTSRSPAIPTIIPSSRRAASSLLFISSGRHAVAGARFLATTFALVESNTSSSRDEEEPILPLLQELSDCLYLPRDFLSKLPGDLRLDSPMYVRIRDFQFLMGSFATLSFGILAEAK
ncbi:hypothetical protein IEQ34_001463 [Dendrobium chrysotoxum]|uniref:Uncharacterized protein n=1 Tax=Dendrobium chrysotoxum TaxID=161865 RepID=A0AAV7H6W8_DENCH|nr:hypothetical protein IEQ34_001463 [Dendrobium chrysotoxum]